MSKTMIRTATVADIPQMAEVFARGFIDDDVCGRFMHPKRREFPEDWLRFWHNDIRSHFVDPAGMYYVGVDDQDNVKACCLIKKLGNVSRKLADKAVMEEKLEQASIAHDEETFTNRAADPAALAIFEKNWDDIKHYFEGTRAQTWFIEALCVHPDVQRGGGYGRELLRIAIELGKSEQPPVPVAVVSSDVADAFYEKYGFREVGRADIGDMSEVKGGSLKFYEDHLNK